MTRFVVDANVIAKWVLPEVNSEEAARLLGSGHELLAPEIAIGEVANLLVKNSRLGRFPANQVSDAVAFAQAELLLVPTAHLLERAIDVALVYRRSVFDCLYLLLAVDTECQYVTADGRAYDALVQEFPTNLLRLQNVDVSQA